MDKIEITFSRTTHYSVEIDTTDDFRSLAKALGISIRDLKGLAANDELLDEDRDDKVARWLDEHPLSWNIIDEENIEDMEVHA